MCLHDNLYCCTSVQVFIVDIDHVPVDQVFIWCDYLVAVLDYTYSSTHWLTTTHLPVYGTVYWSTIVRPVPGSNSTYCSVSCLYLSISGDEAGITV